MEIQKENERLAKQEQYRIVPSISKHGAHTYSLQKQCDLSRMLYGAFQWSTVFEYSTKKSAEVALEHLLSD
jgi:hypothetical protein